MHPSVTSVIANEHHTLFIEFDNKECGILDMAPYLNFGVFSKIKDPDVFKTVRVSFDTIEWANGVDLDPEFVYEKCMKNNGISESDPQGNRQII